MNIRVMDLEINEQIFEGDAEQFLEDNDYDEEIESFLNVLDGKPIGHIMNYYGWLGQCYEFEKLEDDSLYDCE